MSDKNGNNPGDVGYDSSSESSSLLNESTSRNKHPNATALKAKLADQLINGEITQQQFNVAGKYLTSIGAADPDIPQNWDANSVLQQPSVADALQKQTDDAAAAQGRATDTAYNQEKTNQKQRLSTLSTQFDRDWNQYIDLPLSQMAGGDFDPTSSAGEAGLTLRELRGQQAAIKSLYMSQVGETDATGSPLWLGSDVAPDSFLQPLNFLNQNMSAMLNSTGLHGINSVEVRDLHNSLAEQLLPALQIRAQQVSYRQEFQATYNGYAQQVKNAQAKAGRADSPESQMLEDTFQSLNKNRQMLEDNFVPFAEQGGDLNMYLSTRALPVISASLGKATEAGLLQPNDFGGTINGITAYKSPETLKAEGDKAAATSQRTKLEAIGANPIDKATGQPVYAPDQVQRSKDELTTLGGKAPNAASVADEAPSGHIPDIYHKLYAGLQANGITGLKGTENINSFYDVAKKNLVAEGADSPVRRQIGAAGAPGPAQTQKGDIDAAYATANQLHDQFLQANGGVEPEHHIHYRPLQTPQQALNQADATSPQLESASPAKATSSDTVEFNGRTVRRVDLESLAKLQPPAPAAAPAAAPPPATAAQKAADSQNNPTPA